jgi:hypothetical protein
MRLPSSTSRRITRQLLGGRAMGLRHFAAVLVCCGPVGVLAHGGGLNAEGCHNNRKTGDYHCHRAPAVPLAQQVEPNSAAQSVQSTAGPAQAPRSTTGPTCYTGPKGGTYTITASGKKNYGGC